MQIAKNIGITRLAAPDVGLSQNAYFFTAEVPAKILLTNIRQKIKLPRQNLGVSDSPRFKNKHFDASKL